MEINKDKLRPFYIAKLLYENTDEDHYLTNKQIIEILFSKYGIDTTRQTISEDLKLLKALGLEIETIATSENRYHLIWRLFDLPELKTLIDAVSSARFIPKGKSAELVNKLCTLTSTYNAAKLVRNVDVEHRIKAMNEKVYYIMEALNDAINMKKMVSFCYFAYDVNKQQKEKHDGYIYYFSPYELIWNGDYYYVVGYSEKHQLITSFRVDRIARQPKILEADAAVPPADFNINFFLNTMFRMYSGERENVTLLCDNDVMDTIIDRFGIDAETRIVSPDRFKVSVTTAVGHVFYGWIFGFGGKVSIVSPENVRQGYKDMVLREAARLE